MDHNERRRRQNPSGYANQHGSLLQPQAQYPGATASDRFRHTVGQPSSSASSGARSSAQGYYHAYDHPGSQYVGPSLQPSYGAQDYAADLPPPRGSQYSQYGAQNVLYGVSGAQAPPAVQSQYDAVLPYQQQPRESAIEVLGTGFGAVTQSQYYGVPAQEGPTSAPGPAMASQSLSSQYSSMGYTAQPTQGGREALAPSYTTATAMTESQRATSHGGYTQAEYGEEASSEYDQIFTQYYSTIKDTFGLTKSGRLSEAADRLMFLSNWLTGNAETYGKCTHGVRGE